MSLAQARHLAAIGEDAAAKQAYLALLRSDPTDFAVLNELASLAVISGHRSAARSAYQWAVRHHPANPIGRVNLGNLLFEDGEVEAAGAQFQAALAADPAFPQALQGRARVLAERGEDTPEDWRLGFAGHAVLTRPRRGRGGGVPLLLLVSARGGNIPTRAWIDDRVYDISVLYAEFFDPAAPLPPHRLIVNAIGEADLCGPALTAAEAIVARSSAPVINPPSLVRRTGRVENANRLGLVPGLIAPRTILRSRAELLAADDLTYPLLVRAPGHHTGQHFCRIESQSALALAVAALPGAELLTIDYLDANGLDGFARKYRVMLIDGRLYPIHLALSRDWKVHYFTADMADQPAHRAEEQRFLDDMPAILGPGAMAALHHIAAYLRLDYAGVDFGLNQNGELLLFEANATMVLNLPDPDPKWGYRKPAIETAINAAKAILKKKTAAKNVLF